jgi:transposase
MEKIGIDVHKVSTQICVLTETGEYQEQRIRTERDSLSEFFGGRARARVLLEAATESEWVARHLESLGHEVIVADPNFAPMYASRNRKVKTDKRDARALCDACHLGAFRPSHRASEESRLLRKHLAAREALVRTRSRMTSLCRALLRQEGIRVPSGAALSFPKRVRSLQLSKELADAVEPLLCTHEQLCQQIKCIDAKVEQATKNDERVQRLTTVPSVGAVTAVTFIARVDDSTRFSSASKLCSYLGLVPREYSSGEKQQRGHITKAGDSRLRSLLVECAWGILRRANPQTQALSEWALRIAARRGKRIAAVALARKLAGILFAMTQHARDYEPERLRRAADKTPAVAA